MGRFVYSMMVSLDGFVETPEHNIDWVRMDRELHRFANAQARDQEAFVNGRRLYEVMRFWEKVPDDPEASQLDFMVEFAEIWNARPKIVFSSTLSSVGPGARLIGTDHVGDELARLRSEADGELDLGGAMLAATAIRMGLVDEYRLFVQPVAIGAGTPYFPPDSHLDLQLVDRREFGSGVVYLAYRPPASTG